MSKEKQIEQTPKIQPINFEIGNKVFNEMRYLADEMQKAISDEYRRRVLADEKKLEEVLKANGWRKQSDLTPCDCCQFGPPSSIDGKPCSVCPAQAKMKGGE